PAPVLASDPVADFPLTLVLPAHDVAHHHTVGLDGAVDGPFVAQDLRPVVLERGPVAWLDRCHPRRLRVGLGLEEDREVIRRHRPDPDLLAHWPTLLHGTSAAGVLVATVPASGERVERGRVGGLLAGPCTVRVMGARDCGGGGFTG